LCVFEPLVQFLCILILLLLLSFLPPSIFLSSHVPAYMQIHQWELAFLDSE
jgi:hypothetical protein